MEGRLNLNVILYVLPFNIPIIQIKYKRIYLYNEVV